MFVDLFAVSLGNRHWQKPCASHTYSCVKSCSINSMDFISDLQHHFHFVQWQQGSRTWVQDFTALLQGVIRRPVFVEKHLCSSTSTFSRSDCQNLTRLGSISVPARELQPRVAGAASRSWSYPLTTLQDPADERNNPTGPNHVRTINSCLVDFFFCKRKTSFEHHHKKASLCHEKMCCYGIENCRIGSAPPALSPGGNCVHQLLCFQKERFVDLSANTKTCLQNE